MNQHKPMCSINVRCAVYHADGVCNHPKYGKCDCGADFPSQPNSEEKKMMYGHTSGSEVQFSHSPKPEGHQMTCEIMLGRLESDPMPKCTCTPLPDTTEEKIGIGDKLPSCECSSILEMMKGENKVCEIHQDTSNEWGTEVGEILADFENDHNEVKAVNSISSLLTKTKAEERDRIIERIKEMRLHLGYKNDIIDFILSDN